MKLPKDRRHLKRMKPTNQSINTKETNMVVPVAVEVSTCTTTRQNVENTVNSMHTQSVLLHYKIPTVA